MKTSQMILCFSSTLAAATNFSQDVKYDRYQSMTALSRIVMYCSLARVIIGYNCKNITFYLSHFKET